jgi:competence CoiA-like predicted nuclease
MQYALVDGIKVQADLEFKGKKGVCEYCDGILNLRLPTKKIDHWYHQPHPNCDPWWEHETQWHRDWKNLFPQEWREVIHKDETTGERHRADLKTPNGLVVEFQNSPISNPEIISREAFYKKIVWVINAEAFIDDFRWKAYNLKGTTKWMSIDCYCEDTQKSIDYFNEEIRRSEIDIYKRKIKAGYYYVRPVIDIKVSNKIKEIEDGIARMKKYVAELQAKIEDAKVGKVDLSKGQQEKWEDCFLYDFTRRRRNWEDAKKQIFLDFGHYLFVRKRLEGEEYFKRITKQEFIERILQA